MTLHELAIEHRSVVIETSAGIPELVWFGHPLGDDPGDLRALRARPIPRSSLDVEAPATLLPTEASGWAGLPGLAGRRDDGTAWSPRFELIDETLGPEHLRTVAADPIAALRVVSQIRLDRHGVVTLDVELVNDGADDYVLDRLGVTVPVDSKITELQVPEGRWIHEFQEARVAWRVGAIEIANRRGRTSHDKPPFVFAGQDGFTNDDGQVWGAHLGWSGNAAVRAEVLTDGRRMLQLGELLLGDELRLAPGESYRSPTVYLAWSDQGMNGVSQSFHRHLRARPEHPVASRPRPVHLNTWEAVYFDHDLETLVALADRAAEIGVERYVLDDGWFHGRRDDTAGLGDWWVDRSIWPEGLEPLISHVTGLGMEFGLWVEPEMVNPDSDLYRSHPDWVLGVADYEPVTGRNQLVLDLSRPEVFAHLLDLLDRLLADHDISYLKWDMNRDLAQPASGERASAHGQTVAVYRLIDELRTRHPSVEIESCASGGARADYGILQRTDRIWVSDSNDPLERQRIQRGFLRFFPPELMGAHVGPERSHTSGRRQTLGFRTTTAFFGHFGVEWNLLDTSDTERKLLSEAIGLHKEHRDLLHSGAVWQIDTADPGLQITGIVAGDQSEAFLSVAQLDLPRHSIPERVRLPGLDDRRAYDVSLLLLADTALANAKLQPDWTTTGLAGVPGSTLARFGLQLPVLDPQTAVLIHVVARSSPPPKEA